MVFTKKNNTEYKTNGTSKKLKQKGSERLILQTKPFCLKQFLKVNENKLQN